MRGRAWELTEGGGSNGGATGIRKTKDFGDFIKTLTNGIVSGSANNLKMVVFFHVDKLSVAAGND